jgi:hypothetical protein
MKALRLVFGSIVVYLSVATLHACSASSPNLAAGASSGGDVGGSGPASSGHGGASASGPGAGGFTSSVSGEVASTTGDMFDSGIFDALTDPISNASADPVSGSRLKAYYQTGDDGAKAYAPYAWYDSQRQEDCTFVFASDGKKRCMPIYYVTTTSSFFDVQCTQKLVGEYSAGCAPAYAVRYVQQLTCTSTYAYEMYPVLAIVSPVSVYVIDKGICKQVAASPTGVYRLVGPEIPPTSFVGGSYQHD